jgi:hypothetical protein
MEVKEDIYTVCGTPTYVAPEILSEIGKSKWYQSCFKMSKWYLNKVKYKL